MLTEKIKNVLLLILLIVAIATVQGQQSNLTEEDVIAQAQSFFDQEKWQDALPLYAQLVSVHPEKPEYNYKFGVCTLMGNRSDKRRPVRYLNIAYRSMPDNAELLYYLGLAYYQNGEFANAMKFLNLHLAKLDADSPKRPHILEQINACLNGMNLEHKNLVEEILSSTEFQVSNFHRAYRADELEGSLILKPENFVSAKEKSAGVSSFVYVSEPRGILYYSGYENNNSNQRDIFRVALKENGKWGDPERISDKVNTNFDEDYPVMGDNGNTLYFSSKGHNSIGGFDVFRSSYNPETNEFSAPENMGMGINSPFDDILFIPDNSGNGAYYASNRDNLGDGINVYRIRLNNEDFADQHILAQQSIQTKIERAVEEPASVASTPPKETKLEFASKPIVADPQKKAADLVQQKNYMNKLADTAYLMVSNMKNLIRDLTNKRDRANLISSTKEEKAKTLEVEFEKIIADLPLAASKEDFEKKLAEAVKQKEEIFQYRQRADQANLIAWNLGKQIKIKNTELDQLKVDAGEVQSLSVSGDYVQINQVYSRLRNTFYSADTLADYAQNINWLNLDQVEFNIPSSEIAFADKMREGYENQTLLALTQAQQGELATFNESVPINVVDNRIGDSKQVVEKSKPVIVVALQVEQVQAESWKGTDELALEEDLELQFTVDAIEALKLVEPVLFAESEIATADDDIPELDFRIDRVEAEPLIQPVTYDETAFALIIDDEALEINDRMDRIRAADLVQPVAVDKTAFALTMDEEALEINDRIDRIQPADVVQPVFADQAAFAFTMDDEALEINDRIDRIRAADVVQPVTVDNTAFAFTMDDEALEINDRIDRIQAAEVVQPVSVDEMAYALNMDDEVLEVNHQVDRINPEPVVARVAYSENSLSDLSVDEDLEIRLETDPVSVSAPVEPIAYVASAFEVGSEELELTNSADAITPFELIDPVTYDAMAYFNSLPEEEALEIASYHDLVKVFKGVEVVSPDFAEVVIPEEELEIRTEKEARLLAQATPVYLNESGEALIPDDEDLEIRLERTPAQPAGLVTPVDFQQTELAFTPEEEMLEVNLEKETIMPAALVAPVEKTSIATARLDLLEEELDVTFTVDAAEAYALVDPVTVNEPAQSNGFIHEDLEIRIEQEPRPDVETLAIVQPVEWSPASETLALGSEELEIDFAIDAPVPVEPYKIIQPVNYSSFAFTMPDTEEPLEVYFAVDAIEDERLMADNAEISDRDLTGIPDAPEAGTELYYLRESVSIAAEIETSKTDIEMLRIAIQNPELLSYEELLFAASLAPIPEDKLKIYNYAFIHIDRDWRAFNNAAVTAMNMQDLEQAEVYLYQASLISSQNGKVENNMGILACYKQDFITAENHFLAANQLGVNSEYNLQLIKQLVNSNKKK